MKISVWDHYALIASHWAGLASDTAPTHRAVLDVGTSAPQPPVSQGSGLCLLSDTQSSVSCSPVLLHQLRNHSATQLLVLLFGCFVFIFIYLRQELLYLGVTSWPQTHHVTMDNHGLFWSSTLYLQNAGIAGICCRFGFMRCWGWNTRLYAC